jgi:CRP/FNR family cyclic AMP-dependent transcriptional regulator
VVGSGFLRQLPARDREALTAMARSRVFPAGSVLCTEGEPTTHVFILLSGWVKVLTVTRDGREILEALRGEGDVIGEIAGQVTGYRTATVQATGPVRAHIAGARQFEDFLDSHPRAASAHRRAMAERQQAAHEQQRAQALANGAQRLAGLLLDLAEPEAPPPLSQEELASLIGASRSTVTRALGQWRSRHIIGTDQRRIKILDRTQLLRIASRDSNGALSPHAGASSVRTCLRKDDHSPVWNSSTAPDGLRESRTRTRCSALATSTHWPPSLALLVRQFNVERRLDRSGIKHTSVRRVT